MPDQSGHAAPRGPAVRQPRPGCPGPGDPVHPAHPAPAAEPMAPSPVQTDQPGGSELAGSLEYEDLEADAAGTAPAASDWSAAGLGKAGQHGGRKRRPGPGGPGGG